MKRLSKPLAYLAGFAVLAYLGLCLLLYSTQRSYLYFPVPRRADVPVLVLPRGDARVQVSTNAIHDGAAVLYFGGNAEDVSQAVDALERAFPGASIYAMHYRGYGGSTGEPSEAALVGDAVALYDLAAKSHRRFTVVGRSLGSGIAVQVAASRPVGRLVLVTPYASIAELAQERFPMFPIGLLLTDKYESWRHATRIHVPTTIIVAEDDQVIPLRSTLKLAQSFPSRVAHQVLIRHAGHNDLSGTPEYLAALADSARLAPSH